MDAIVYTSQTGSTRQYAQLLSQAVGLPAYSLQEAKLPAGAAVFYLGWLKAGGIQGLKKARSRYQVAAIAAVGLSDSEKQQLAVKAKNKVGDTPFFLLMGAYDRAKLTGMDGFLMDRMTNFLVKNDPNPAENPMIALLTQGGDLVSLERLAPVLDWWRQAVGPLSP